MLQGLLPTVVNITAFTSSVPATAPGTAEVGQASAGETRIFTGSGFVIDPSGLIVTNLHVIDHAYRIMVTLSDQSRYPARMLSASRVTDIALIDVQVGHPLPTTHWGDSDKLEVGDPVVAIGNPLGIGESVSSGIVSGLNRNIMESPYDEFIQTDAAINHGNSGGPLFDMKGEVIGIDTAIVSPTTASAGLGFAIPANDARFIVDQLRKYGALRPGWLGFKVQQVTPDMAEALGMPQPRGSIVAYLDPNGPAEQAGLQVGDVITAIGGELLSDERELLRAVAKSPAGQVVSLGVLRAGQDLTVMATVSKWPLARWDALDSVAPTKAPPVIIPPDLGLTFAPPDEQAHAELGVPAAQTGVVVTGVMAGSDAARHGIIPGDIFLQIGTKRVTNADEVRTLLQEARASKTPFLMALVLPKVQSRPGPNWLALRASD